MKGESKEYIKGFKHGVKWEIVMAKCEVGMLNLSIDNIVVHSKEAIKSLKEGR